VASLNTVTLEVGPGTHMDGKATNQDLASKNVPKSFLTRNNFRLARDSGPIPGCFRKLV
jgi:hypothetical protein